ncbi:hypothetical protein B9W52_18810 [Acinetobacter baumannii]|nr:hypothetical protein B9W52_18810 [Acinetobacter baumannii]
MAPPPPEFPTILFGGGVVCVEESAAWLSSARVVRCWVKSRNERNPFPYLPAFRMGTLRILPVTNWRKAGTTSSHHGPYGQGYTRATMVGTKGCYTAM